MAHGQITALLLLLLSATTRPSLAQPSDATSKHTSSGQRALVAFSCVAFVIFVLLLAICQNRGARPHPVLPAVGSPAGRRPRVGLDRALVEAFPRAVYGDVKAKSGPLECAVCLAEFAEHEELRVLPPCCHVFHPACIDPWLAAAATCPLCRADLTSENSGVAAARPAELTVTVQDELGKEECGFSSFGAVRMHEFTGATAEHHQRTLRLPEHVMMELAAVGSHRRTDTVDQRRTTERNMPAAPAGNTVACD